MKCLNCPLMDVIKYVYVYVYVYDNQGGDMPSWMFNESNNGETKKGDSKKKAAQPKKSKGAQLKKSVLLDQF